MRGERTDGHMHPGRRNGDLCLLKVVVSPGDEAGVVGCRAPLRSRFAFRPAHRARALATRTQALLECL